MGECRRLLIVSNRLPITAIEKNGEVSFEESVGGLVSGLSDYLASLRSCDFTPGTEYVWVGWPGIRASDGIRKKLSEQLYSLHHAVPVFMSEKEMENFYHGFCNRIIWPLFHSLPSYAAFHDAFWTHYRVVNQSFCDAVMKIASPDDIIWVHDYHLMLLPSMLRKRMPDAAIGYFLHIPFPTYEIFRLLPRRWRSEILEGLLGSDLIGFHTHDDTHYFLTCVLRILGHENRMRQMAVGDRLVKADTFPMGINVRKFRGACNEPPVRREIADLRKVLKDLKVILSVDRLDYTKGIINRLRGFEVFLEKSPSWRGKVVLALVIVPSRVGVEHYQRTKSQIDELVGKINGKFGVIGWTPILYQYRFLPFDSLSALYCVGDVALITPLRDGMNLIAKEYVAARSDGSGVLILSEMAGAARELKEAIAINPNKVEEIAEALETALEMPPEEQARRMTTLQETLESSDVVRWAGGFIGTIEALKQARRSLGAKVLSPGDRRDLAGRFRAASARLLVLDYDGTLVPFAPRPELAKPGSDTLGLLEKLAEDPTCDIAIVSGRDRVTLDSWLGSLATGIVAENGSWIREKGGTWRLDGTPSAAWKEIVRPILDAYTGRVHGSFVEEKSFSLVWHYRGAEPQMGFLQAKELISDLVSSTAFLEVQILHGSKALEIRSCGTDKGTAVARFLSRKRYDFILAAGDDWTDEHLMTTLPAEAVTIRVGTMDTRARYFVPGPEDIVAILRRLAGEAEG